MKTKQILDYLRQLTEEGSDKTAVITVITRAEWGWTHSYAVSELLGDIYDGVLASLKTRIPNSLPARGLEYEDALNSAGWDLVWRLEQIAKANGIDIKILNEIENA